MYAVASALFRARRSGFAGNGVRQLLRSIASDGIDQAWHRVCTLGATVGTSRRASGFAHFGHGSIISFPPGTVFNERWISVGDGVLIGPRVSLSVGMVPDQPIPSDRAVISIGNRCVIGQGGYIVGHQRIDIGDDVQTGPYVYITDQNHGYEDPDLPIGIQWPVNKGVSIGPGTWIGTGAVILPGSSIGTNVVVGAGSVVTGEVPDRCVVVGAPARIVRRYKPGLGWRRYAGNDREVPSEATG